MSIATPTTPTLFCHSHSNDRSGTAVGEVALYFTSTRKQKVDIRALFSLSMVYSATPPPPPWFHEVFTGPRGISSTPSTSLSMSRSSYICTFASHTAVATRSWCSIGPGRAFPGPVGSGARPASGVHSGEPPQPDRLRAFGERAAGNLILYTNLPLFRIQLFLSDDRSSSTRLVSQ